MGHYLESALLSGKNLPTYILLTQQIGIVFQQCNGINMGHYLESALLSGKNLLTYILLTQQIGIVFQQCNGR